MPNIDLDYIKGEEKPWKAKYVGWATRPIHPRLGLGKVDKWNSHSYSSLMKVVLHDLEIHYLDGGEFPRLTLSKNFGEATGQKLEDLTLVLLSRDFLEKLINKKENLDELINTL